MTEFAEFVAEIEREAAAEGPEAVAQLARLRAHFEHVARSLITNPEPLVPPDCICRGCGGVFINGNHSCPSWPSRSESTKGAP